MRSHSSTTRKVADEALYRAFSSTSGPPVPGSNFVLSGTSAALTAGDCFCLAPFQESGVQVTKATPSALAQAGILAGIADSNVTPGQPFTAPDKLVPSSVTSLVAASGAQNVTVGPDARLRRIGIPSGVSPYVSPFSSGGVLIAGVADANGNVTLVTSSVIKSSAADGLNLVTFGADPTGATDSLPAFNAAMAAVSQAPSGSFSAPFVFLNGRVPIFVPPGSYTFSGPLFLYRSIHLYAHPPGRWADGYENAGAPATALIFPKGSAGLIVPTESSSFPGNPGGPATQGQFSVIENIFCIGGYQGVPGGPTQWLPGTHYSAGDIVRFTYPNPHGYAYRARNFGTSGANQPRPSTNWPVPPPTYSVNDNGITWDMIQAHGLIMGLTVYARNCSFYGFAGHGIAIPSSTPDGYDPDCWYLDRCFSLFNGGSGLCCEGADSNAGQSNVLFTRHNGEYGIYDTSILGNLHNMTHSANAVGAGGYYIRNAKVSEPYSEAGDGPFILTQEGGVCLGGQFGDDLFSCDYKPGWPGAAQAVTQGTIIRVLPGSVWAAGTTYVEGDVVQATGNIGYWFVQIETTGVSAGAPPTWVTTIGLIVTDGTCTWMCMGGTPFYYATNSGVTGGSLPNFAKDRNGRTISRQGTALVGDPRNIVDGSVEWCCYGFATVGYGLLLGAARGGASPRNFEVQNNNGPVQVIAGLGSQNNPEVARYLQSSDSANPILELYDQSFDPHHWAWQVGASPAARVWSISVLGATEGPAQSYTHSKSKNWTNGFTIEEHVFRVEGTTADNTVTQIPICDLFQTPSNGFPTASGTLTSIEATVFGRRTDGVQDFAKFSISGSWSNAGGVMTPTTGTPIIQAGEPTDSQNCTAGATAWRATSSIINGTQVGLTVTGANATPISWSAIVKIYVSR